MKKLLFVAAIWALSASGALAQCNGVFQPNTICGNTSGSPAPPKQIPQSAITGIPGGTNGQTQYNNSGSFGGYTPSGDVTVVPSTGVETVVNANNISTPLNTSKGGTGISNATNAANDILASNGANGNFVHTVLTTLINAACTVTPNVCSSIFGGVSPAWYGAKCDGSTDDTTAIQNMNNASGGNHIVFPAATCVISNSITFQSNTTISGQGRDISVIKQTGRFPIIGIGNVSQLTFTDLWLQGTDNYISWTSANTGAIFIAPNVAQSNLTFRNLKLSGFNANFWILGQPSVNMFNVTFDNILMVTTNSDIPTDPTSTNNGNFGIQLQSAGGGIRWENTTVNNVQIDGAAICIHYIQYSNFYKYRVTNNRMLNPGGTNSGSHCTNSLGATNAYGIAIYDLNDDGNPPTDGIVQGNYVLNPIASGIYIVGDGASTLRSHNTNNLIVTGNLIVGQSSSDSQLPRAAISVNDTTDVTVIGNKMESNQNCIYFSGQNAGDVSALANDCVSTAGSSGGIILAGGNNGSSNTDRRFIRGNSIDVQGTAILGASLTGSRFNDVDISDNSLRSASNGINFGSNFVSGTLTIQNNSLGGALSGTPFNVSGLTGPLAIFGNTGLSTLATNLPTTAINGSNIFVSDGAPTTACTGSSTGSNAFRQNSQWKCF